MTPARPVSDGGSGDPVLEFACLLARRAGCTEVLVLDDTSAPTDVLHDAEPPVDHLSARALGDGGHLLQRAMDATVVIPFGLLDSTHAAAALVRTAPFTIVTSTRHSGTDVAARLEEWGVTATFIGSHQHGAGAGTTVAVLEGEGGVSADPGPPPAGFGVTAFVTVFNEEDILGPVLDDLAAQGVAAYVLDNWSTDGSWDIARARLGGAVVGAERWPAAGAPKHFDLRASLERITELSRELQPDWAIKHDADEIRRSPWPGVPLREALWRVQSAGYNIVDFTVLNYQPTDDSFRAGDDPWTHFQHFEFGDKPGHFKQFKAWRVLPVDVDFARFGSHRVEFPGARIAPYKFELHHFPVRSQQHGGRKVLTERQGRYLPAARMRGWHTHYDHVDESTDFLRDADELLRRDETTWYDHRVELLSGAGLARA